MSGTVITAAIVAALVAVTLIVFSGSGGDDERADPATTTAAPAVCQPAQGNDCVQAARDIAEQASQPLPTEPYSAVP